MCASRRVWLGRSRFPGRYHDGPGRLEGVNVRIPCGVDVSVELLLSAKRAERDVWLSAQ